jgi:hypothetical protein
MRKEKRLIHGQRFQTLHLRPRLVGGGGEHVHDFAGVGRKAVAVGTAVVDLVRAAGGGGPVQFDDVALHLYVRVQIAIDLVRAHRAVVYVVVGRRKRHVLVSAAQRDDHRRLGDLVLQLLQVVDPLRRALGRSAGVGVDHVNVVLDLDAMGVGNLGGGGLGERQG